MRLKMSQDKVKQALKSNCSICGEKIRPYQLFKASETIRGSLIFAHEKCLFPHKYEKQKR